MIVVIGTLLIVMALTGSVLRRLPVSASMLYLAVGVAIGPAGAGLLSIRLFGDTALVERVTEVALGVSVFTAGLKLRPSLRDPIWRPGLRLASAAMVLTIGLVSLVGVFLLGLPVGAAMLLGAVLAPTDPVLASDVQVGHPGDTDRLRFTLTAEAGLNDGAAFPFVMLGLGLSGLHDLGPFGLRWLGVDVAWAVVGGLGIGALLGTLVARLVLYLRREHAEAAGLDEFLTLGLIVLAYGLALLAHAYGLLAVFAAGLAVRGVERRETGATPPPGVTEGLAPSVGAEEVATHPEKAPVYMAHALLGFTEQLERIGEVAVVVLLGTILAVPRDALFRALWFVPLFFLVLRPVAVRVALGRVARGAPERRLISWFGIRGIGSLYYLSFALERGLPAETGRVLAGLTLAVVTASVVLHGVSVTPLMERYRRRTERYRGRTARR